MTLNSSNHEYPSKGGRIPSVLDSDYRTIVNAVTSVGIYVITQAEHQILYFNDRVKEIAPEIQIGNVCHEVWAGTCENCPLHIIGDNITARTLSHDDPFGKEVEITATRMLWRNKIPAFLIRVYPRANFDEVSKQEDETNHVFHFDTPPSVNGLYTINSDFRIVDYTDNAKIRFPQLSNGKLCYQCLMNRTAPCDNCPVLNPSDNNDSLIEVETIIRESERFYALKLKPNFYVIDLNKDIPNQIPSGSEHVQDQEIGIYQMPAFYCTQRENLPANHDQILESLLRRNFGVGLLAGYYDEDLSINFIDGLALAILKYPSYSIFKKETGNKTAALLHNYYRKTDIIRVIRSNSSKRVSQTLRGWHGSIVHAEIFYETITMPDGKEMWYAAIRPVEDKHFDPLTGGCSRTGFVDRVEQMRASNIDLSKYIIMYLNIDNFKSVNELFSTVGGDNLLRIVYMMMLRSPLKPIICGRLESDHFIALFDAKNLEHADFQELQSIQWTYNNKTITIRARCGLYHIENSRMAVSGMIDRAKLAKEYIADEYTHPYAMYNRSMQDEYLLQASIGAEYKQALKEKQFKVFYQPVVDAQTCRIVSAEALIRWEHPTKGLISPSVFLPTLEQNGSITKIDEYVNNEVFRFQMERHLSKKFFVPVSVNLSWMDFGEKKFIQQIINDTHTTKLPSGSIRYELTETAYVSLEENEADILDHLRAQGVKILLDDFGSGTSSLAMIQKYEFDILKLDKSFIRQIGKNEKAHTIIEVIIWMCHKLGIKVIAEGAETTEQVDFLCESYCDYIQGYFFSKPLCESDYIRYLDDQAKNADT